MAAAMVTSPLISWGQAKIYTKKARMADFQVSTTKVVSVGQSMIDLSFRDIVISRWHVNPYEFCTIEEYEALKTNNSFYFLCLAHENGILYMILSKGGQENEQNMLKIPFEVVRIPIGTYGAVSATQFSFWEAFIDIVQQFAEEAMESDSVGYSGISSFNGKDIRGMKIILNPEESVKELGNQDDMTLVSVIITPPEVAFKDCWCYKMLINAGTHELYYYEKSKYRGPSDARFTDAEIRHFKKRHAVVR